MEDDLAPLIPIPRTGMRMFVLSKQQITAINKWFKEMQRDASPREKQIRYSFIPSNRGTRVFVEIEGGYSNQKIEVTDWSAFGKLEGE